MDYRIYIIISDQEEAFIKAYTPEEALTEFALSKSVDYDLFSVAMVGCESLSQKIHMVEFFAKCKIFEVFKAAEFLYDAMGIHPERSLLNSPWLMKGPVVRKREAGEVYAEV